MKMFLIMYRLLFYGIHSRLTLVKRKLLLFQAQEISNENRIFVTPHEKKRKNMCVLENKYVSKLLTAKGQKLIVERRKTCKVALRNSYGD